MAVILHPAPLARTPPKEGWGAERATDTSGARGRVGAGARGARIVFCDFSKDLTVSRQNALYIGVSRFLDLT